MADEKIINDVKKFIDQLQNEISIQSVYLFGSYAKANERKDSDIDVAIVSDKLFDEIMESIRKYQMELRKARRTVSEHELEMYHSFLEYGAIGWMRPDKLPYSFRVQELKNAWFDFFTSISHGKSEIGNYKVSAGVFKSYGHLEQYTFSGIESLRIGLSIKGKND